MTRRRPPAYARELVDARRQGLVPERHGFGHVALVLSWDERRTAALPRLVVPPDLPVEDLDVSCLAGLDVLLVYRRSDASRAIEVMRALAMAGAVWVCLANVDVMSSCVENEEHDHDRDWLVWYRGVEWLKSQG